MRICLPWTLALLTFGGCVPDVPEHAVLVTTNCQGPEQSAVFHFPAHDFSHSSCGGWSEGGCSSSWAEGEQIDGRLDVTAFRIEGTGGDPVFYRLWLPQEGRDIECTWYVDDALRLKGDALEECWFADCWAELLVLED